MDLEGDETSLGICWAAAASFLEWAGCGGGGGGVGDQSLRQGGELSPPLVGTKMKKDLSGEGPKPEAKLLTLWDIEKTVPVEPKPSGPVWC